MGYRKVETRAEIRGFWTRKGQIEMILGKRVEKGDNMFYLGRLLTDAEVASKDPETGEETVMTARKGDTIGVSGTAGLVHAFDDLPAGMKFAVRLTSHGKKPNKKGGGEFWDIGVEIQPASEVKDDSGQTPF